jgi:hypothetical protein
MRVLDHERTSASTESEISGDRTPAKEGRRKEPKTAEGKIKTLAPFFEDHGIIYCLHDVFFRRAWRYGAVVAPRSAQAPDSADV